MDADFVLCPLALTGAAAILDRIGPDLLDGVEEHMGGAAGGVHFPGVVGFHDFDVRLGEEGGGLLHQPAQNGNTQTHITRVEHGNFFGGLKNQGLFLGCVAGGADDGGGAGLFGVGEHIGGGGVVREVHDHVGGDFTQLGEGLRHVVFAVDAHPAHNFLTKEVVNQLAHGAVGAAENHFHTFIPNFLISFSSFSLFPSSMGVRGSRR